MSKCLNTYGGCENPPIPLEYHYGGRVSITSNFCSSACMKRYSGNMHFVRKGKSKNSYRIPPKTDWVIVIKNKYLSQTFIWDNTGKRYLQYHLGIGLVDDMDNVIAKEDSNYFKSIIESLDSEFKEKLIKPKPSKIPKQPIKHIDLPKGYYLCNGCGQIIRVIGPKITNMLKCPNCNVNIFVSKRDLKKVKSLSIQEILPKMI
jgi:DNA-directed RNA polymerase subunit RPC12/RpoP